jgi:Lrp/AsnC family transcriptional regulator, leucine-responsive regulatory protein
MHFYSGPVMYLWSGVDIMLKADAVDLKILHSLQANAALPNLALARKVGLSPACRRRVPAPGSDAGRAGVICRRATLLDPAPVGLGMNVFVQVTLDKQTERTLQIFEKKIFEYPEVLECYLMTGEADYLLRAVLPNMESFESFVIDRLQGSWALPGCAQALP